MLDVVAMGECLIDFTPSGTNSMGMQLFARNPGGAPANVLAMNAKLGGKTAFIGKVGQDNFGDFLKNTMEAAGIDCSGLCVSREIPTTLAFVQLDEHGDRSFSFYRKPGADVVLCWEEIDRELLERCHIFHFGSISMTDEPCRTATMEALRYAKEHGALISYDPNYRPLLWDDEATAIREMRRPLPQADIVKVSEEEMTLLTGETELEAGAKALAAYGVMVVFVTLGENGAYYYTATGHGLLPTFDVKAVDTTGAGDAFLGAVHYQLAGKTAEEIKGLSNEDWAGIVRFGNAAGSLATTAKGAIPAMPDLTQIEACLGK